MAPYWNSGFLRETVFVIKKGELFWLEREKVQVLGIFQTIRSSLEELKKILYLYHLFHLHLTR